MIDMPKLDPIVVIHKLNLDPITKEIVQKEKVFFLKRQKTIVQKLKKLKIASFI